MAPSSNIKDTGQAPATASSSRDVGSDHRSSAPSPEPPQDDDPAFRVLANKLEFLELEGNEYFLYLKWAKMRENPDILPWDLRKLISGEVEVKTGSLDFWYSHYNEPLGHIIIQDARSKDGGNTELEKACFPARLVDIRTLRGNHTEHEISEFIKPLVTMLCRGASPSNPLSYFGTDPAKTLVILHKASEPLHVALQEELEIARLRQDTKDKTFIVLITKPMFWIRDLVGWTTWVEDLMDAKLANPSVIAQFSSGGKVEIIGFIINDRIPYGVDLKDLHDCVHVIDIMSDWTRHF